MGAVIVPSTFSLDMFRSAGVTAPLYKFPLGVDPLYQPVRRTPSDVTTFLAFMDRGKRKGGTVAIQAFLTAFGDNPKYQLVLKGRRPGKQIILFDNPNIKLIQQDMSEQELYELYCRCDVMIFPTMGEGFGLPPREFSASGGVTLATAWGGTADDIEQWGYPIPYELVPADWTGQPGLEGLDLGQWAMPCIDSLAAQMQQIVEHRSIYADIAYQSAPHVHELYSWRRFAEQVYDVWRGLR
jgi:glycosyltransferase involved in cell wall biosynthesis